MIKIKKLRNTIENLKHEISTIDRSPRVMRKFGFVSALILLIGAGFFAIQNRGEPLPRSIPILIILAIVLLSAALFAPSALRPLNTLMLCFSICVGRIVNILVLTCIFFVVFTPIALIMRLFKRDALGLGLNNECNSFWKTRSVSPKASERYPHLF